MFPHLIALLNSLLFSSLSTYISLLFTLSSLSLPTHTHSLTRTLSHVHTHTLTLSHSQVFLRDIWPNGEDVATLREAVILPSFFREVYSHIKDGTEEWNALKSSDSILYEWDPKSTYIREPTFFTSMVCYVWSLSLSLFRSLQLSHSPFLS
jgi:hypothetical protein